VSCDRAEKRRKQGSSGQGADSVDPIYVAGASAVTVHGHCHPAFVACPREQRLIRVDTNSPFVMVNSLCPVNSEPKVLLLNTRGAIC
jgi:hypothetical protein